MAIVKTGNDLPHEYELSMTIAALSGLVGQYKSAQSPFIASISVDI
jgi:hypothetical protein